MKHYCQHNNRQKLLKRRASAALSLLLWLLCIFPVRLSAQELTTLGTDFWVAMMPNHTSADTDSYQISVSGPRPCIATVSVPNTNWTKTLLYQVANSAVASTSVPYYHGCVVGSCVTSSHGIHVTANDSIRVWAFCQSGSESSCDGSIILPTQALGTQYIVHTPSVDSCPMNEARAQFSVLATENNTTIDILLSDSTSTGLSAGDTLIRTLQAGQIFQVQSPSQHGDFSGTVVTSRDCKKIAVFSGATATQMPSTNTLSYDHTYQQNLPIKLFSNEWILTPSAWHDTSDYVRITAGEDGCQIFRDNTLLSSIDKGQTYQFKLTEAVHLTTSQPATVYQYLDSRHASNDWGDVAMFIPNSINQILKYCAVNCYSMDTYLGKHYINIVVPTEDTSLLRLNYDVLTGFRTIPGTDYSYIREMTTQHSFIINTTGSGFTAYTYGLSQSGGGYAMAVGGIDTNFLEQPPDTVHIDTGSCTHTFNWRDITLPVPSVSTVVKCDTLYIFHLSYLPSYEATIDSTLCVGLRWGDTLLTVPGRHTLIYTAANGCDSVLHFNLRLKDGYDNAIDTATCDEWLRWEYSTFAVPGDYLYYYKASDGCDSVIHLHISVKDGYDTIIDTSVCDDWFSWSDSIFAVPGEHQIIDKALDRCDSTTHLFLSQYPSYEIYDTIFIEEDDTYTNRYGRTYAIGDSYTDHLHTIHGCDSIIYFSICNNESKPRIWAPNVFTPNQSSNNVFRLLSKKVTEMRVDIYQRQGEWICTFDGLTESWDGTKNGRPCPAGTYVYIIRYKSAELTYPKPISGTVTLIR